ncbi:MAG TPA: PDZ domain-containing protein [Candidatus Polarisedimenticolia bacterium]|nr:PDZ domain-containing protein [Candidatus Polarisedimenticolia bacterium]
MTRRPAARAACLALAATLAVWHAVAGQAPAPAPAPAPGESSFPSLEAIERELASLAEATRPSVVGVVARARLDQMLEGLGGQIRIEPPRSPRGEEPLARRIGSGVVLDDRGHVATLASVVSGAAEVFVLHADGARLQAAVRGVDDDSGLAVLAVDPHGTLRPPRLGEAEGLKVGSLVTTLGAARAGSASYSVGFVVGKGVSSGPIRRGPYLKLDAYTAPGAAGGPVFDSAGRLVGILFGAGGPDVPRGPGVITWETAPGEEQDEAGDTSRERDRRLQVLRSLHRAGSAGAGISYAVPIEVVRRVSEEIIRSGGVKRGWLGVTIESSEPGDVRLTRVFEGSPAQSAGLRVGDRILRVDGEPVASAEKLVETIALSPPGRSMRLQVQRQGQRIDVPLVLSQRPGPAPRHPLPRPERSRRAAMGVVIEEADDASRRLTGLPEGFGLVVRHVMEDSRAEEAGLRPGDVIVEMGEREIRALADLRAALRSQGSSDPLQVRIMRGRTPLTLPLPPPIPREPPEPPHAPAAPMPRRP